MPDNLTIDSAALRLSRELGGQPADWAAVLGETIRETYDSPETAYLSVHERMKAELSGDSYLPSLGVEDIAHAMAMLRWDRVYIAIRARMLPIVAPEVKRTDYDWFASREENDPQYHPVPWAGDWLVLVDSEYHPAQTVLVRGAETAEEAIMIATLRAGERFTAPESWWCGGACPLGQRADGKVVRRWA